MDGHPVGRSGAVTEFGFLRLWSVGCQPPLPEQAPDLRYVRRVEHSPYDLRDGDQLWVPAERTGGLSR